MYLEEGFCRHLDLYGAGPVSTSVCRLVSLVRSTAAFGERLLAIMSTGYEAELHSETGGAGWRGDVPQRRPASQFPPRRGGSRSHAVSRQPVGASPRSAGRRG